MEGIDLLKDSIDAMTMNLASRLDEVILTSLKAKGFIFENKYELTLFIKEHCTCEHYLPAKQKKFFVDGVPFLMYDYNTEIDLSHDKNLRTTQFTAHLGSYTFL